MAQKLYIESISSMFDLTHDSGTRYIYHAHVTNHWCNMGEHMPILTSTANLSFPLRYDDVVGIMFSIGCQRLNCPSAS